MASYPTYAEIKERRLSERRSSAIRALKGAEELARSAGGRLLVFGSLAEGGFHEDSDLDVALCGVSNDRDLDLAAEIDTRLSLSGFEVSVIPERFLQPSLYARIMKNGRRPDDLA